MKKVAICISGHIRTLYHAFPKSLNEIKRFNQDCEFHVYASFWNKHDGRSQKINDPIHYICEIKNHPDQLEEKFIYEWFLNTGISNCNIKMLNIDNMPELLKKGEELIGSVNKHLLPQYFSTKECFSMVSFQNYDYVVRIRPDIVINNFPCLSDLKCDLVTNTHMWYNQEASNGFENEMIWIAKSDIAKETASLFDKIIEKIHSNGQTYGEAMTGRHFSNIKCSKSRFNFNYRVAR